MVDFIPIPGLGPIIVPPGQPQTQGGLEAIKEQANNFGKIEIADVFIFIGLGLIFGNQIAGITDKISHLIRSQV